MKDMSKELKALKLAHATDGLSLAEREGKWDYYRVLFVVLKQDLLKENVTKQNTEQNTELDVPILSVFFFYHQMSENENYTIMLPAMLIGTQWLKRGIGENG